VTTVQQPGTKKPSKKARYIGGAITILIVVVVFGFFLPKFANFKEISSNLAEMSTLQLMLATLGGILAMVSFWWVNMASLPGLKLGHAAVATQTSYAVANTVPVGGPISLGFTYEILTSYRFAVDKIVLMVGVGGIWNVFGKFIVPVLSIVLLAITGEAKGFLVPAIIGVIVLTAALGLMFLVLWKESLARALGNFAGKIVSWFLERLHKPPMADLGEKAATFRSTTIGLIRRRWVLLTITAVANQLSFFVVLLICMRGVGITSSQVTAVEAFAAFAFSRLATSIPITPGGVGIAEAAYTGMLISFGASNAEALSAVLIFRFFTYLAPIPIGAFTYVWWRRTAGKHFGTGTGTGAGAGAGAGAPEPTPT